MITWRNEHSGSDELGNAFYYKNGVVVVMLTNFFVGRGNTIEQALDSAFTLSEEAWKGWYDLAQLRDQVC